MDRTQPMKGRFTRAQVKGILAQTWPNTKFFNRTWCQFDWAAAQAMAAGEKYERPHTLSAGDTICDMRWYVDENHSLIRKKNT